MTAGVVTLEVIWVQSVELSHCRKHIVIQNRAVSIGVELTMNRDQGSHPKGRPSQEKHPQIIILPTKNLTVALAFSRQTPDSTVKGEP